MALLSLTRMMIRVSMSLIGLMALSACGGSTSGAPVEDDVATIQAIGMGTSAGAQAANGLPFADHGDGAESVEGETIKVRMARMHRDRDTGALSYLVSDETVTVDAAFVKEQLAGIAGDTDLSRYVL